MNQVTHIHRLVAGHYRLPFLVATILSTLITPAFGLTATPSTTEGPYYTLASANTLDKTIFTGAAGDNDLLHITASSVQASGTVQMLSGTLVNTSGTAIAGAVIELWEADNNGIYYYVSSSSGTNNYANRDTLFQHYGTCTTDSSGAWSFLTIRPGLYTGRIRHFHLKINIGGTLYLTTQLMPADEAAATPSDNIVSGLGSNLSLCTYTPTTGLITWGSSTYTGLIATKQLVVNYTVTTTAPSITTQPSALSVSSGSSASFSVTASGTSLTYQWYKDGSAISGATSSSYGISSATTANAGTYYVIVTNTAGSATSSSVALTVTTTGTVTVTTPATATVTTGHEVTISAASTGSTYQWQVSTNNGTSWTNVTNGTLYSGATTNTLTLTGATAAMSGYLYRVQVNGSTNSSSTTLTVSTAYFPYPVGITIDSSSNLYVADSSTHIVGKITSAGVVTTLAGGTGTTGTTDASGTAARFNQPNGVSSTSAGIVYVADTANATIRKIAADGTVTTFAGSTGTRGNTDGTGTAATFSYPVGVAQDSSGNVYVADATNHSIRKITSAGVVTTFAGGAGISGTTDGTGTAARFNYPTGVTVDSSNNLYVADTTNNTIRKITSAGVVTTLAGLAGISGSSDGTGNAALFNTPGGLAVDSSGNLFVADTANSVIRKITSAGVVTTYAGLSAVAGLLDGTGNAAWLNQPKALVLDSSGNLFVADTGNAAIRKITAAGVVTTAALTTGTTTTTTTTTTGTTTSGTTGTSSSSGGGGGAPSHWFFALLGVLTLVRFAVNCRTPSHA